MFLCVSAGSSLRRFGQSIKRIVREVEQQESGGDDELMMIVSIIMMLIMMNILKTETYLEVGLTTLFICFRENVETQKE